MDFKEALLYAKVSALTYIDDVGKLRDYKTIAKFENKGTDTQGLFGVAYDDTLVIAFRGSEETGINDWITDLKFMQDVFTHGGDNGIKVHSGMNWAYDSVREVVMERVKGSDLDKVACTGHSLGAGLATLAAMDIKRNYGGKAVRCYTYGSPKVGNKHFVAAYQKLVPETYRIVNGGDSVPDVPPMGYAHVGKYEHIGVPAASVMERATRALDHVPQEYIKVLREMV